MKKIKIFLEYKAKLFLISTLISSHSSSIINNGIKLRFKYYSAQETTYVRKHKYLSNGTYEDNSFE